MEEEKKLKAEWEERNKNKSSIQTSINGSAVSNHQQHEGGDAENGSKKHESEASDIWTMQQIEEKSQELQKRLKEDDYVTKREKVEVLSQYVSEKSELEFEEDFFSMTIFSYMECNSKVWNPETNTRGWGVKPEK